MYLLSSTINYNSYHFHVVILVFFIICYPNDSVNYLLGDVVPIDINKIVWLLKNNKNVENTMFV